MPKHLLFPIWQIDGCKRDSSRLIEIIKSKRFGEDGSYIYYLRSIVENSLHGCGGAGGGPHPQDGGGGQHDGWQQPPPPPPPPPKKMASTADEAKSTNTQLAK